MTNWYFIDDIDWCFSKNKLNLTQNLIISANLPYIKAWDKINMDKEVYTFEPELALYWWEKTGFELYEKLISENKLGDIFMETNLDMHEFMKEKEQEIKDSEIENPDIDDIEQE